MDVQHRLKRFIVENFYVSEADALSGDTHLITSGIVDSTGMLEIIGFIEREFGIQVDDGETTPENLSSIDRIAAFVDKKSVGRAAARAS